MPNVVLKKTYVCEDCGIVLSETKGKVTFETFQEMTGDTSDKACTGHNKDFNPNKPKEVQKEVELV